MATRAEKIRKLKEELQKARKSLEDGKVLKEHIIRLESESPGLSDQVREELKEVQSELVNVQKVTLKKFNDLLDVLGKQKVPEFDTGQLEAELKNVERLLNKMNDNLVKQPSSPKNKVNIAKKDIEALGQALSNIYIPQPPPASPPFSDSQGQTRKALIDDDRHVQVDVVSGSSAGTEYTEGDTDTTLSGTIALAEGPSDTVTPLQVDASKHLQVDIAADSAGIGGGTQYTEGDTDASITGTAALMEVAADTLQPVQGTVADGLLVNLGTNNDVTLNANSGVDVGDVTINNAGGASAVNIQDGGNTITVDGTVTANLSATDNAVLDSIDTDTTTIIGHVDGIEGLLTTIDADTGTLAGAVSGTEMQVDVVASLPAGTNAIGKLAANSGVDIGDVDVTTLPSTIHSEDYDTGAGTDTTLAFGIAVPASGGAVVVPGDATAGLKVDLGADNDITGTVTANLSATDNAVLDAIEVDTTTIAGAVSGTEMQVDVVAALPAGTNAIGKLAANSGVDIGDVDVTSLPASTNTIEVVGDVAHDAAAAGNPNIVAGVAQDADDTAPPNRISTEGDATRIATDFDGAVFTRPHGPQVWSYHSNGSTALTDDTVHAAPGAGLSLYVTDIVFSSGAATAINLFFEESTTTVLGPYYLEAVAGRGMGLHFSTPKKITANTALTLTTSASIAHSVDVTGYVAQG